MRPIYLYIKKHNTTGMLYFGRTVVSDPNKYNGSGSRWNNHLKKHGKNISTIYFEKFENQDDATEFATFLSEEFDIVKSNKWANLIIEDAKDYGNMTGYKHTEESRSKMSKTWKYKYLTEDIVSPFKTMDRSKYPNNDVAHGKHSSEETRRKISESVKYQYNNGKISPFKTMDKHGVNNPFYGKSHSAETKAKISNKKIGIKRPTQIPVECPHCGKIGIPSALKRWHFDNCKLNK